MEGMLFLYGDSSSMPSRYQNRTICVLGLGYIGLPTATAFASRRIRVLGVDISQKVVDTVNQGRIHIVEPDLDMLVQSAVSSGYLRAALTPEASDVYLIAVPTPFKDDHQPDLSYIEAAARSIAPLLKSGDLVILESTSPVGATEQLAQWMAGFRPDLGFPHQKWEDSDIRVAHCPERVLPGKVVRELVENDRIIGGMTPRCAEAAKALYRVFVTGSCVLTDTRTAEMCKLAENAFRDVNIAFANELSLICDRFGISVWELIRLANLHPRVNILQPGPGVGGHCIAVDPWFLVSGAPEQARLIRAAREVNDSKPGWVLAKVDAAVEAFLRDHPGCTRGSVRIVCFGLTFKPDIDDMRQSPALAIARSLSGRYPGQVWAAEPHLCEFAAVEGVELIPAAQACDHADIPVVLVRHKAWNAMRDRLKACPYRVDVVGLGDSR